MNILIPYHWLLEHLDTDADPKEIQRQLSLAGPSVERIYDRDGEPVFDIEVTTNRVDSMSVRGIAREAAVILNQAGHQAALKPLPFETELATVQPTAELPLPEIENNIEYCNRIMCAVLSDIQKTPTPDWMAAGLTQTEQNIHHAAIDITNYITHDLGHPCHAFDYDKIMALGGKIIVKIAEPGKKFTTLDGEEYETLGGEIVFENPQGEIIDLPAIKGTANTAVDHTTKNILLWIESLDAKKVRFASMSHAIRTVAAQLNEKHVDPHLADLVMAKGIQLYREICQAQLASKVYDEFPGLTQPPALKVTHQIIENYLGIDLKPTQIQDILKALGCQVTYDDHSATYQVAPPTYRPDIQIPVDVVEEIARIYGYHNLPSVLMPTAIPLNKPANLDFEVEHTLKHFLANIGWQELYTYSMVSQELALASGYSLGDHLKIQNELTEDRVYLRRSLIPSLQEALDANSQKETLTVFEFANIYQPRDMQLPEEKLMLSFLSKNAQLDTVQLYRQIRGVIENLLKNQLFAASVSVSEISATGLYSQQGELTVDGKKVGVIGITQQGSVGGEIEIAAILQVANSHPVYQPTPRTSPVLEDLTFTLSPEVKVGNLMASVKEVSPLVHAISLKGEPYQQNFTFTVEYLNPDQNLSSEDVQPIRHQLVTHIEQTYKGQLVGAL